MQPILCLIFNGSTIWSLTNSPPQGKSSLESILFSQLLSDPEDYNTHAGSTLPRVKQLPLVLLQDHTYRLEAWVVIAQPLQHQIALIQIYVICILYITRGYQYELGGSAFNNHFQNQLCHLSWQTAFPIFSLREAEKTSLAYL